MPWTLESGCLGRMPVPTLTVTWGKFLKLSCFTGKGREMILVLPYGLLLHILNDLIHVRRTSLVKSSGQPHASTGEGVGSISGQGTKFSHAQCSQEINKNEIECRKISQQK